jgi:hypothetical protein
LFRNDGKKRNNVCLTSKIAATVSQVHGYFSNPINTLAFAMPNLMNMLLIL